jgi:energy-coupling factor transport system substrate-specific component
MEGKMKNKFSVRTVVAIGIGAAVFVILGRFLVIPTGIPNTNMELTHPFVALMATIFGPVAGGLIALIGHALKDFTTYGSAWWSWVVCSGIMGVIYGLIGKKIDIEHGIFGKKELIFFVICEAITNMAVWAILAPTMDILVYSEPANKVYLQGIISGVVNTVVTAVVGGILMKAYASTKTKEGSLKKD